MIPLDILINYTFTIKKYAANQLIFEEGNTANYFYLIENGQVKMFNQTEDGKEFI